MTFGLVLKRQFPHLSGSPSQGLFQGLPACGLSRLSCPTLCDPMGCSPPGPSVNGILQARILEWIATPSSRGSSRPGDGTQVSHIAGGFFTV